MKKNNCIRIALCLFLSFLVGWNTGQEVRDAGLGELLICGGGIGPMVWENHWAKDVFDFTGDYMDLPMGMHKDMIYRININ